MNEAAVDSAKKAKPFLINIAKTVSFFSLCRNGESSWNISA
jgi:hypothetical protein